MVSNTGFSMGSFNIFQCIYPVLQDLNFLLQLIPVKFTNIINAGYNAGRNNDCQFHKNIIV